MNITDPIREHASREPDALAWQRHERPSLSYAQYDAVLDGIAQRAIDAGLRPGQLVAVSVERDFAFMTTVLALARVGVATFMPVAPDEPCDARVVSPSDATQRDVRTLVTSRDWFVPPARPVRGPAPHAGGSAACHVFRTSGTTGTAKRVAMSHDDVAARAARRLRTLDLPRPLRTLSRVRPRAGYGFQVYLSTLWAGGTMVESFELKEVADRIERHGVTWLVTPPGVLAPLIDAMPPRSTPFPSLVRLEVSGSRLTPGLAKLAAERVCASVNVLYGSTEAGVIAHGQVSELAGVPDAVGRIVPGVDVEAVDEGGMPVPPDTDGILRFRGDGCSRGYVGDTGPSRAFRDGWFYSGDMGRVVGDVLVLRGRADERINVGGAKSSPEALESVVLELPGVVDVAAFSVASPTGLDRVGMALVTGPSFDFEAFKAACHQRLGILSPEIVLRVGAIPRNENGKVQRQALAQLARTQAPQDAPARGTPRG